MSTYWDIHCRTCNKSMGINDANHKGPELQVICDSADTLVKMAEIEQDIFLEMKSEIFHGFDLHFFLQHRGHDLVPKNEYGGFYDKCCKQVVCETCGHLVGYCDQDREHEGPHRKVPPKPDGVIRPPTTPPEGVDLTETKAMQAYGKRVDGWNGLCNLCGGWGPFRKPKDPKYRWEAVCAWCRADPPIHIVDRDNHKKAKDGGPT